VRSENARCRPVINYCLSNVDMVTRHVLQQSGFDVIEDLCLQRCGQCQEGPYLVVDGEVVTGTSHGEILDGIHPQER